MRCLLVLLLAFGGLAAGEAPLDTEAYRAAALTVATHLAAGRSEAAELIARAVASRGWRQGESNFAADPAFSAGEAAAPRARRLQEVAARLETLTSRSVPDRALLARLLPPEESGDPAQGLPVPDLLTSLGSWVVDGLRGIAAWIGDQLLRLLRWLRSGARAGDGGWNISNAVVIGAVALVAAGTAVIGVMAWRRRHRRRLNAAVIEAPRVGEEAIDRPMGEWERLALELSANGRHREAIRAWFNASLAAAFALGRLAHRRGRTNWEYVAQAPAQAPWRATMFGLVDTFETTWYGGRLASAEDGARFRVAAARFVDQVRAESGR